MIKGGGEGRSQRGRTRHCPFNPYVFQSEKQNITSITRRAVARIFLLRSTRTCDVTLEILDGRIPVGARVAQLGLFAAVLGGQHVGIQVLVQGRHLIAVEEQLKNT